MDSQKNITLKKKFSIKQLRMINIQLEDKFSSIHGAFYYLLGTCNMEKFMEILETQMKSLSKKLDQQRKLKKYKLKNERKISEGFYKKLESEGSLTLE